MTTAQILLNTMEAVKEFTVIISGVEGEVDLVLGRYVVDAKSIMGIFSLDVSEPLELRIHKGQEQAEQILEKLQKYLV